MVDDKKVALIKIKALEMAINAGFGHVSSAFSCAEIICVLYYEILRLKCHDPKWEDRDRFVMSKNHGSLITYPILQDLGMLNNDYIFNGNGSPMGIHTKSGINCADFCGGSLGIGLGFSCGLAYSGRLRQREYLVFCIVGDGECYEGSIWESILFAGAKKLDNLIMIIDRNGLCITDFTERMLPMGSLGEKIASFGWEIREINGHNINNIRSSLSNVREHRKMPLCIIANTIKGKGIDYMENIPLWHGKAPMGDDVQRAKEMLLQEVHHGC